MSHHFRSLLLIALIIALPLPLGVQAAPPLRAANQPAPAALTAPAAFAWYDGPIDYSTIINCASIIQGFPYQEHGASAYVGFLADLNAGKPAPNDIYYVHIVIGGLGNSCSAMRAYPDLVLPASTSLAIDASHPVYCFYFGAPISPCPQSLPLSAYHSGAYAIPSSDAANGNMWPIQQGRILEFQIPVKSSTALSNSLLQANVLMLDGNSSPWLLARQGVYVFSGQLAQPTISYPSPSTITVTATSGHSEAYLYTYGAGGTGYFDLGTTTSYGLIHEMVPIAAGSTAWVAWDEWGPPFPYLTPDTLYHWRFTFTPSGGSIIYGVDQTFRTLPDGRVTIGQGQPAACTESAFNSALATAKEIFFECGALPITITVSSAKMINSNLTINGGHKVTLSSGVPQPHFMVQAGGHLTLTQLSLVNGTYHAIWGGCGGSINVANNAQLTLSEMRFFNNNADAGGALCVLAGGTAEISASQFNGNSTSVFGNGGAIANAGSLEMYWSDVSGNSASIYGGGIYNSGNLDVGYSLISGNSANIANATTTLGGGLYNSGVASLSASTISSNWAKGGGGISSNGPGLYLTGVTIANNTGDPGPTQPPILRTYVAGGLDYSSGVSLYNTILSGNLPGNCNYFYAVRPPWTADSNNLDSADRCHIRGAGDLINADAKLGPLQNNGGRTRTQALGFGSRAIDTGSNLYCGSVDQRGVARPIDGNRDGSAVCDIGAYEAPPQWGLFLPLVRR
jgi:hypothetical protein